MFQRFHLVFFYSSPLYFELKSRPLNYEYFVLIILSFHLLFKVHLTDFYLLLKVK